MDTFKPIEEQINLTAEEKVDTSKTTITETKDKVTTPLDFEQVDTQVDTEVNQDQAEQYEGQDETFIMGL